MNDHDITIYRAELLLLRSHQKAVRAILKVHPELESLPEVLALRDTEKDYQEFLESLRNEH